MPKKNTKNESKKLDTGADTGYVSVYGACEHNLQNLSFRFPREQLVVVTGLSGSGKSSLAFDTIYAEGQYRYAQTFSAYARSFIGELRRPSVDKIEGLSPVIAIEQRTTSSNPRSTIGTQTDVYDFLRVMYARIGKAYAASGKALQRMSIEEIVSRIQKNFTNQDITLFALLVRGRKGHYRELFAQLYAQGYLYVEVDGELIELKPTLTLDRYRAHDIALVIDRLPSSDSTRLQQSVTQAIKKGKGVCMLHSEQNNTPVYFSTLLADPDTGFAIDLPSPNTFSFNSPKGACSACKGLGLEFCLDEKRLIPDPSLCVAAGGLALFPPPSDKNGSSSAFRAVMHFLKQEGVSLRTPLGELSAKQHQLMLYGTKGPHADVKERTAFRKSVTSVVETWGIQGLCLHMNEMGVGRFDRFLVHQSCACCQGKRLQDESLRFRIQGKDIVEVAEMPLDRLKNWIEKIPTSLSEQDMLIAKDVLAEINKRIALILDLGLHYVSLARRVSSLSGGELQRIRLATQLGNQLVGVMYLLDEPSIGLHACDNNRLIASLAKLRDMGNSVVVVEHDRDLMLASDHIIDMGPGAGTDGGHIVAAGTPKQLAQAKTLTADYLSGRKHIYRPCQEKQPLPKQWLVLKGASGHNLKKPVLKVPLGRMIGVTGVSGSGKSTLIHKTLVPILRQQLHRALSYPLPYEALEGLGNIDKVIEVDQRPIGRTPRSNPATYTGIFTDIRNWYAQLPEAQLRGYTASRFSFNLHDGRCKTCQGNGLQTIEMDFLPDVYVPCPACHTKRYNDETLEVRYQGRSIGDVLDMPVDEALSFFENQPYLIKKLQMLQDVGLGYIRLGQHATTLSGGEAQRLKLSTELMRKDTRHTFYVLDEPTTGLHFQDITHLLYVLNRLVSRGNTVLIIEHNLEVMAACGHLIDLGAGGGEAGGRIIDQGAPQEIARRAKGATGEALAEFFARQT